MSLHRSWIESANSEDTQFPLNNLPYGVFSREGEKPRCGIAIGDLILDVAALESEGVLTLSGGVFKCPNWNSFMKLGPAAWDNFRKEITDLLSATGSRILCDQGNLSDRVLVAMAGCQLHMPFAVVEYTDFYACRQHAFNVGSMLRGPDNALSPNWLHIPIGYNGRSSSVVVSGTDIRRPLGQLKSPDREVPIFSPSRRLDFELELGAVVGESSTMGQPITVEEADRMIFGYVLLNDWSARDIQAWEYQPLGPFQAKAFATSISPWIVSKSALEPFRCSTPTREKELLPYLKESGPMLYDIDLQVNLTPSEASAATAVCRTNYREMYYSSAQQLCHHAVSGCPMRVGDLLGSGTISGPEKDSYGSMLELSLGGKEPLTMDSGEQRGFLEDGDHVSISGEAKGDGFKIGFGTCDGRIVPAPSQNL